MAVASAGSSSSSNKMAITIGVVIGAVVIAGGIGVWVFRKWKLSPSRQFKSKIRNSNLGAPGGSAHGDDAGNFASYTDIFRPPVHDSALPITASSMVGPASATGSSSPLQSQQYQHSPYDQQLYDPQAQPPSTQSQHMSLSSTATVPDYGQYRYVQSGAQGPMMSSGYDSGVPDAILGQNSGTHLSYGSDEYGGQSNLFLRELLGSEDLAGSGAAQKAQGQTAQSNQDTQTHAQGIGHQVQGTAQKAVGSATNDSSLEARGHGNAAAGDAYRSL
ncbi:hypothetical protein BGZ54_001475 [Gamsiella multidivaricata]|nr:hypothetical protein BGZ54_001475 [Gamsiella multidivaricata]